MPFNNSISKYDWQYIFCAFLLILVFIFTDLIRVVDKEFLYFVPRLISDQPYRIYTSILAHADLNHLFSISFDETWNCKQIFLSKIYFNLSFFKFFCYLDLRKDLILFF